MFKINFIILFSFRFSAFYHESQNAPLSLFGKINTEIRAIELKIVQILKYNLINQYSFLDTLRERERKKNSTNNKSQDCLLQGRQLDESHFISFLAYPFKVVHRAMFWKQLLYLILAGHLTLNRSIWLDFFKLILTCNQKKFFYDIFDRCSVRLGANMLKKFFEPGFLNRCNGDVL